MEIVVGQIHTDKGFLSAETECLTAGGSSPYLVALCGIRVPAERENGFHQEANSTGLH